MRKVNVSVDQAKELTYVFSQMNWSGLAENDELPIKTNKDFKKFMVAFDALNLQLQSVALLGLTNDKTRK